MSSNEKATKGWIYCGHKAIPVDVFDGPNSKTWRVKFTTRKMGFRGSVKVVDKRGVSFIAPHLVGGRIVTEKPNG